MTFLVASMSDMVSAQSQTDVNPLDGLKYVWIRPGTFQMGCSPGDSECDSSELPTHSVTLTKGFWIGQTLVTQAAFKKVRATSPSNLNGDDLPVEQVTWDDADAYCRSMNMRLPTEAEWEYAARARNPSARYGPIDEIAWYGTPNKAGTTTHPVAKKQPNADGLYDMLGNVWEWTADWKGPYAAPTQQDPKGPSSGTDRILRGGSFLYGAREIRVSSRYAALPEVRFRDFGFRCVANGQSLNKDVLPQALLQVATRDAVASPPPAASTPNSPPNSSDRSPASTSSAYVKLSNGSDGNRYFIVFAARPRNEQSTAGHAFVGFGKEDISSRQSSFTAYGLYQEHETFFGKVHASFGQVPAKLVDEITPYATSPERYSVPDMTSALVVEVNERTYSNALSLALMVERNPGGYQYMVRDCVTMLQTVANSIGLQAPERDLKNALPQAYVADLIRTATTPTTITGPGITYTGQTWMGKIPNGDGTFTLSNGDKFTGHVAMGSPRKGTVTYANGNTFTGTLKSSRPDGQGTYTWSGTGEHMDAQFEKGDPKHGTYHWKDGTTLEGDLKDGRFSGSVVMKMPDGSKYEGNWTGGPQGHGALTLKDGSRYEGEWNNGKPQGHGTLTLNEGSRYEGDWNAGKPNGNGTVVEKDGSRATGKWTDGKLDVEHAQYRDVDGREHGFEERDRSQTHDDMGGSWTGTFQEDRPAATHEIHGMEIEGGRGDE